ncbi:MAG TPA: hypothetical protein VJV79_24290 [Polyangiaceae bacterium]|nr:hypothetical protein [Polyangiaceae bacterium]
MSNRRWTASLLLALVLNQSGLAFAQSGATSTGQATRECARAYENSQEYRAAGAISNARLEFERCRRDDCPAFIRSDCTRWSREAEAEQPTIIFSAKRSARELTDVRVSTGARVWIERLSGRAVELDPGEYDFRFESAEGDVVVQHALIQLGNKDRLVQVQFAQSAQAASAVAPLAMPPQILPQAGSTARAPKEQAAAAPISQGPRVLPWVLLAVGAASVGTGAGLGVWGRSDEAQLRDSCSPNCTDAQVQPVRTKYLLSNISFGLGLLSLSAAAYLFLRRPDSEPAAGATVPVTVVAGPSGVQAAYGARF